MKATNVKATFNTDGIITFTGLDYGTYTLTESKTPDGYSAIDPIEFTISRTLDANSSSESAGGTVTWASSNEKVTTDGNTFAITVENVPGSVLPTTGGMGTAAIYVAGIVVIARKRMA